MASDSEPKVTRLPSTGPVPAPDLKKKGGSDKLFDEPRDLITDFAFNADTVAVFDDMVDRSVPYYQEIQRMACELAADFSTNGGTVYDLGCSTATTLTALDRIVDPSVPFIGVDNSADMLDVARQKFRETGSVRKVGFINADLQGPFAVEDASVVMMLLSLMFVRPLHRHKLMKRIYDGMRPEGALILVEKITIGDTLLNRLFIKNYYDYKRRHGYSEMEIAQKREALENVLIPYRFEENVELLREIGFRQVDQFFRWYNFSGIVAVK